MVDPNQEIENKRGEVEKEERREAGINVVSVSTTRPIDSISSMSPSFLSNYNVRLGFAAWQDNKQILY